MVKINNINYATKKDINCYKGNIKTFVKQRLINKMVGKTGFEPATPWSQTKCSTKLSHFPIKWCTLRESNP